MAPVGWARACPISSEADEESQVRAEVRSYLELFTLEEDLNRSQTVCEGELWMLLGIAQDCDSHLLFRQILYLLDFKIHIFQILISLKLECIF